MVQGCVCAHVGDVEVELLDSGVGDSGASTSSTVAKWKRNVRALSRQKRAPFVLAEGMSLEDIQTRSKVNFLPQRLLHGLLHRLLH